MIAGYRQAVGSSGGVRSVTGPPLHRLIEGSLRNGVIPNERDQLLDVAVVVVPRFHAKRQVMVLTRRG